MKRTLHIRPTQNGWLVFQQYPSDGTHGLEWSFESTAALVRELPAILEPDKVPGDKQWPSRSMAICPSGETNETGGS